MTVHLVGAGPGDPGLLTLRGAELLRRCDVVVHDRLCGTGILDMVPPWAERIDVGKVPGEPSVTQTQINEILIDRARRFECVVRLKGGDPFVFGRGSEEIRALTAEGIDASVVPGVSSALAAPSMAGISLTDRNFSSGFTVITARQASDSAVPIDWSALARLGTTLVILMGARLARSVAERLIDGGMSSCTPVAIVTDATLPSQTEFRLTLGELGIDPVPSPSVIIVGELALSDLRSARLLRAEVLR